MTAPGLAAETPRGRRLTAAAEGATNIAEVL
jgi:hypothetical protein